MKKKAKKEQYKLVKKAVENLIDLMVYDETVPLKEAALASHKVVEGFAIYSIAYVKAKK